MNRRVQFPTTLLAGALLLLVAAPLADAQRNDSRGFQVNTRADTVDANPGDRRCADASRRCSLRAAIQEANVSPGADRIALPRGAYQLAIAGAGEDAGATGDLDVTSTIVIDGLRATLDARNLDRGFDVRSGGRLTVNGLGVAGGAPPAGESGGGFRSAGSLVLDRARVVSNTVSGTGASGGGVLNDGGGLRVTRSRISSNRATRAGGGIEVNAGVTRLDRVTLFANSTGAEPGNGGGLHVTGAGRVSVSGSRVLANTAAAEGGGLWNSGSGTMSVRRTRLSGNSARGNDADQGGGGLYNDGGTLVVRDSRLLRNDARGSSGSGGGILNNGGRLRVLRTVISGNVSQRAGGGIEANVGSTGLDDVSLTRNRTGSGPGNGGGLHLTGAGSVRIDDSTVLRNSAAAEGGGLWSSEPGTMRVTDTRIRGNRAPDGPNVYNDGGTFTVDRRAVPDSSR